jgi:hypothetical protein
METNSLLLYLSIGLGMALLILLILRVRLIFSWVSEVATDTLKMDGKWSKVAIITASAWFVVLWAFTYDEIHNGFNETAWMFLGSVAVGNKWVNALSKKADPTITAPSNEQKS